VIGVDHDNAVVTTEGRFTAPVVVDCSGWRGAVVNSGATARPARGQFSSAVETHTDLSEEGLYFWLDRGLIPRGLGWVFPVGKGSLIGLGLRRPVHKLQARLERFLRDCGTVGTTYHGTISRTALPPHRGPALRRGPMRGACLPLTAEGDRPPSTSASSAGASCSRSPMGGSASRSLEPVIAASSDGYRVPYQSCASAVDGRAHAHAVVRHDWRRRRRDSPCCPLVARYGWFGRFDPDPVWTGTGAA